MGAINLYRVDRDKQQIFLQELTQKMTLRDTIKIESTFHENGTEIFSFTLYTDPPRDNKGLSWNWVLEEFHIPKIEMVPSPKAVVIVEKEDNTTYAVTFGHAFFLVDKFCDRNFGFDFARKVLYKEIKTTTLTTPNSQRNKIVNTYINYSELEFDSGESFAKLKAKASLPDGFTLYKPSLEIGSSIKFLASEKSLVNILSLILHVENILASENDKYQIPVFSKVSDLDLIQILDRQLIASVFQNPAQINFSELDIIGATEIFNHNDSEFVLRYGGQEKTVCTLSNDEIEAFCREHGWNYGNMVLDISVVSLINGDPVATNQVKNLIDYTDDHEKCLLSKGLWYRYNDDYLNYLRDSVAEIDAEYHSEYDFSATLHHDFIDTKYYEEKDNSKYDGKIESEIRAALKKKYYAERAFNLIREQNNGFENFDRQISKVGGSTIEQMDLYKDGKMCAVKIGNTSAKLCYAVDQSLTALKLYKHNQLPGMPSINTVVLWFVLERQGHIEDADGKPDLNRLDMLMLRNRLDQWKKEVRLQGYRPLVYINYRLD